MGHGESTGSHRGSEQRSDRTRQVSQVSLALVCRVEAGERQEAVECVCPGPWRGRLQGGIKWDYTCRLFIRGDAPGRKIEGEPGRLGEPWA